MFYLTGVRLLAGGCKPWHITDLRFAGIEAGTTGMATRTDVVKWIEDGERIVLVNRWGSDITVRVAIPREGPPFLRSAKDDLGVDRLLRLVRV